MTITDHSQFQRQVAIVDLVRTLPDKIVWHAISDLPLGAQNDLYDFLHAVEAERCDECGGALDEDDVDLCADCGDRMSQILNLQEMMRSSGVVFGEYL